MKRKHLLWAVLPLMALITGCPVGVDHPLGEPGKEKLDEQLIGTWVQPDTAMEATRIAIEKIDKHSFKLTVLEEGGMFMEETDFFRGWCTKVDGYTFVYLQDLNNPAGQYLTYCYRMDGDDLYTYDMTLAVGGIDAVTSTEAFRKEVSASLKLEGSLTSEVKWSRQ
ncbi:MAG TPA: hypothetical protein PK742_03245 [Chitinophagales bacterium]|nr:hypothetical protein [Chitinophagales bacterium]